MGTHTFGHWRARESTTGNHFTCINTCYEPYSEKNGSLSYIKPGKNHFNLRKAVSSCSFHCFVARRSSPRNWTCSKVCYNDPLERFSSSSTLLKSLPSLFASLYIYIYIYIYNYIYVYIHNYIYIYIIMHVCVFRMYFLIEAYLIEYYRCSFSVYFCFNPFKSPYSCFDIRLELANRFSVLNWLPSTFVPLLGHHQRLCKLQKNIGTTKNKQKLQILEALLIRNKCLNLELNPGLPGHWWKLYPRAKGPVLYSLDYWISCLNFWDEACCFFYH